MSTPILEHSKKARFWIENDILFCKFNQIDCFLSETVAKFYLSKIEDLVRDKSMPLIVDLPNFVGNFSPKAAKLIATSSIMNSNITAQAFVASSLQSKLLVGSYIRIYTHNINIKIFNDVQKAFAFCLDFKNKFDAQKD